LKSGPFRQYRTELTFDGIHSLSFICSFAACASGMMISAAISLVLEALAHASVFEKLSDEATGDVPMMADDLLSDALAGLMSWAAIGQVLLGIGFGIGFVLATQKWLASHEDVKLSDIGGLNG